MDAPKPGGCACRLGASGLGGGSLGPVSHKAPHGHPLESL